MSYSCVRYHMYSLQNKKSSYSYDIYLIKNYSKHYSIRINKIKTVFEYKNCLKLSLRKCYSFNNTNPNISHKARISPTENLVT